VKRKRGETNGAKSSAEKNRLIVNFAARRISSFFLIFIRSHGIGSMKNHIMCHMLKKRSTWCYKRFEAFDWSIRKKNVINWLVKECLTV